MRPVRERLLLLRDFLEILVSWGLSHMVSVFFCISSLLLELREYSCLVPSLEEDGARRTPT
ncbi:hypothetical protein D3C79_1109420 [compost metagenome]